MKLQTLILVSVIISFCSCQQKENEVLRSHVSTANRALVEQISYWRFNIQIAAYEYSELEPYHDDARFYFKQTMGLLDFNDRSDDSLRFWRITETAAAKRYGHEPVVDPRLLSSDDTLLLKLHLLENLHSYLIKIIENYTYCAEYSGIAAAIAHSDDDSTVVELHGLIDQSISNYHLQINDSTARWALQPQLGRVVVPGRLEDSLSGELIIIPKHGSEIRCLSFSVGPDDPKPASPNK